MNANSLYKIELNDLKIYAYHGYYPEEQVLGNDFIVNLTVCFDPKMLKNTEFVNYEVLRSVILSEMNRTQKLLETVLENIQKKLQQLFPFFNSIEISIKKPNPLFGKEITQAQVTLIWNSCENLS